MHTKCRSAANLAHNVCVKFTVKFSISLEIAAEPLGGWALVRNYELGQSSKALTELLF